MLQTSREQTLGLNFLCLPMSGEKNSVRFKGMRQTFVFCDTSCIRAEGVSDSLLPALDIGHVTQPH